MNAPYDTALTMPSWNSLSSDLLEDHRSLEAVAFYLEGNTGNFFTYVYDNMETSQGET